MYCCENCNFEFKTPEIYRETHGFTDGLYESFLVCPRCGSGDYEEAGEEE